MLTDRRCWSILGRFSQTESPNSRLLSWPGLPAGITRQPPAQDLVSLAHVCEKLHIIVQKTLTPVNRVIVAFTSTCCNQLQSCSHVPWPVGIRRKAPISQGPSWSGYVFAHQQERHHISPAT